MWCSKLFDCRGNQFKNSLWMSLVTQDCLIILGNRKGLTRYYNSIQAFQVKTVSGLIDSIILFNRLETECLQDKQTPDYLYNYEI